MTNEAGRRVIAASGLLTESWHNAIGIIAALGGAGAAFATVLEAFETASIRIPLWAFFAAVLATAAYGGAQSDSDPSVPQAVRHGLFAMGALVFAGFFATDLGLQLLRDPVQVRTLSYVSLVGGFVVPEGNLSVHDVDAIAFVSRPSGTKKDGDAFAGNIDSVRGGVLIQKRRGVKYLVIHDVYVTVHRRDNLPQKTAFQAAWAASRMQSIPSLKARIRIEGGDFSRPFSAKTVAIGDGNSSDSAEALPVSIGEDAIQKLDLWISAAEPGIYLVSCGITVADGLGTKREVSLVDGPLTIAFVDEPVIVEGESLSPDDFYRPE